MCKSRCGRLQGVPKRLLGRTPVLSGKVDSNVIEHVGPTPATVVDGRQDHIGRRGDCEEQGDDSGKLESIVEACKSPVELDSEEEMDE